MINPYFSTKLGSIYHGNCLSIIEQFPTNYIDLVVTSPPYNVGIDYDNYDDKLEVNDYYTFLNSVFSLIYSKLKSDGRIVVNVPYECKMPKSNTRVFIASDVWQLLKNIGYKWAGLVHLLEVSPHRPSLTSWGSWLSASAPYLHNPNECCIIAYKDVWKKQNKGKSYFIKENKDEFIEYVSGQWKYKAETKGLTKANFSLDIPLKAIKLLSYENDLILDAFSGSFTTAVACEQLNRKWIGCELSTKYCEIGKNRLKQLNSVNLLFGDQC